MYKLSRKRWKNSVGASNSPNPHCNLLWKVGQIFVTVVYSVPTVVSFITTP